MITTLEGKKRRKVLLLNASEEIISIIDWKKAVTLLYSGKARRPFNHSESPNGCHHSGEYEIRTTCGIFRLPFAIVLIEYVRIPYKKAKLTRENVFRRDQFCCQYCGEKLNSTTSTLDHVIPVSRGGRDTWENLVASCKKCNANKGNQTLKEARMRLMKEPTPPSRSALVMTIMDEETKQIWGRWLV